MPAQASGVLPNALASRIAISGDTPRRSFTNSDKALRDTPSAFAPSDLGTIGPVQRREDVFNLLTHVLPNLRHVAARASCNLWWWGSREPLPLGEGDFRLGERQRGGR